MEKEINGIYWFLILNNSLGGIVLTCNDRKTVCANTLDERLELCF